jgi:hypothetical protein
VEEINTNTNNNNNNNNNYNNTNNKTNINNIKYPVIKPLLDLYLESTKNNLRDIVITHITEEPNALTIVQRKNIPTPPTTASAFSGSSDSYDSYGSFGSFDSLRQRAIVAFAKLPGNEDLLLKLTRISSLNRLNRLNRLKDVSGETGYNIKVNKKLIKYSYNLLYSFFQSMYCLIGKPVYIFTPDKVIIQLNYFLNIPKFKVFKWYSICKNKKTIKYREALINKKKRNNKRYYRYSRKYRNRRKRIHWKVTRTLIRLMNKETKVKNIVVNLNKYSIFKVFSLKFKLICEILNNKFNKPVEFQLIRIHKPYLDSNILVNLLSLNIMNKKFKPNVRIFKLFQKRAIKNVDDSRNKSVNFIPSFVSGIKIRIGGRLLREHLIPKRSTKKFERGASSVGKVNFLDTATVINKNKRGSYTLKISSGQNFF